MKATHRGTCQVCGALHKLPGGFLAKHGYTVDYGTFNGVCYGSGELPFEQERRLVDDGIARAEDAIGRLSKTISELRIRPTEPKGWHSCWRKAKQWGEKSSYFWREVEISRNEHGAIVYADPFEDGKPNRLPYYGLEKDLLDVAKAMNEIRARFLETTVLRNWESYVKWQKRRLVDWQVRPLYPIEGKIEIELPEMVEVTTRE